MIGLSGWGRYPTVACKVADLRDGAAWTDAVPLIARGNGRAYGDAALQPNLTLLTRRHDRLLTFEPLTGRLTCESGVLLTDLLDLFVPRGWFPPVTPGTKHVTVGGMVAADVHGKNHHGAGSFGRHVERLTMALADGRTVACGPDENPDLFQATVGGMGLTGVIFDATFRLIPIETAWVRQETVRCPNLEAAMTAFEDSANWTYTVAWIDCLNGTGRSLLHRGEHAKIDELPPERRERPLARPSRRSRRVPFDFPSWALNRHSIRAFNALYYGRATKDPIPALVDLDTFFYPLDALLDWNRIYGRGGFTQYQCVLPKAAGAPALRRLLDAVAKADGGSFLAVLKLFGSGDGLMSFPMEGYTLALDFPLKPPTLGTLIGLDRIVAEHGGRLYLAKDARMTPLMLRRGYPGLERFQAIRSAYGAIGVFQSLQAERLGL